MKQALHIFKKDVRYLRWEIGLVLALAALLGRFSGFWLAQGLFSLAAGFLIALAVHAEAIPGDTQFWITRPYRWQSLLAAKVCFVLLFVSLPLMLAQLCVVLSQGFSLGAILPGWMWCQVLILVCTVMPVTAVASLTQGIAAFLSVALIPLTIGVVSNAEIARLWGSFDRTQVVEGLKGVEWVPHTLAATGCALISGYLIYAQYRWRHTAKNAWIAVCASGLVGLAYWVIPWPAAFRLQAALSEQKFDASGLTLTLDPDKKWQKPGKGLARSKAKRVEVEIPLALTGLPENVEAIADAISIGIRGPDGRIWKTETAGPTARNTTSKDTLVYPLHLLIDRRFYEAESGKPATARIQLYLTLLSEVRRATIPLETSGVNTIDGLQCRLGVLDQLYCISAFRWPRDGIYAGFERGGDRTICRTAVLFAFSGGAGFQSV